MHFLHEPSATTSFMRMRAASAARGPQSGDGPVSRSPHRSEKNTNVVPACVAQCTSLRAFRNDRRPVFLAVICAVFLRFAHHSDHHHGGFEEREHSDAEEVAWTHDERGEELADAGEEGDASAVYGVPQVPQVAGIVPAVD